MPPWIEFFTFSSINVIHVVLGCSLLGASAGAIGCFSFLRKRSLIGDALAHAALPGVCVAFMLTGTKNPLYFLLGAGASCWLGAVSVDAIVRYTRCKEDSALGMVLSVFFGVGILLLTYIQKTGDAAQSGLDHYLFGKAASLVESDVKLIAVVSLGVLGALVLAYKELKVISFDPDFAGAIGLPRRLVELMLATMIVLSVAIGLQAVGVVLMAALLVTPAAAARYWTDRLNIMLMLAAGIGAFSGFFGAYVSYLSPKMPTGPWIVVAVTSLFLASLMFAPRRGVLSRLMRHYRFRKKTARENVLRTLYLFGERADNWEQGYLLNEILHHRLMSTLELRRALYRLERNGLIVETPDHRFALTAAGVHAAARITRLHRLWELYLTRKLEIAPDHVHDDAEEIEHIITPELEKRLIADLGGPQWDPHEKHIPPVGGVA
ncbi:MAG: metal ABC transporter permease [Candidatus Hydrogenedentes bacterium]|nr:metal ABC transporter permease [Candidatus Hydrogenedentota bacterium]